MANLILALVSAELSLFGVAAPVEPAAEPAAADAGTAPRFDSEHYRSALG
ncbi:hypothetical protein [Achromobacter sp. RTa]|nr:hypothetical protein [Achromobacter sp. RTa]